MACVLSRLRRSWIQIPDEVIHGMTWWRRKGIETFDGKAIAMKAKETSRHVARLSTELKNEALVEMATRVEKNQAWLIAENQKDLSFAEKEGLSRPMIDRLRLTPDVIQGMSEGLRQVAGLPDPVGEVVRAWTRPNGLKIARTRIPLGVIGIIYESRPNVTSDAAGLCLKSGNSVILGGSEAFTPIRPLGGSSTGPHQLEDSGGRDPDLALPRAGCDPGDASGRTRSTLLFREAGKN
jgi:hypothetical protein